MKKKNIIANEKVKALSIIN